GEGRIKFVRQIGVEIADASRPNFYIVGKIGPAAQVNHDFGQGLVQRAACLTEATNPMLVSERFFENLAQHEADIFHGVMIIDVKIASRPDLDIEQPVADKDLEHVIEKRHASFNFGLTLAVEIQGDTDLRLLRFSLGFSRPSHGFSFSLKSRFYCPRMVVEAFKPRELSNLRRQGAQRLFFGVNDGGPLEKVVSSQR